MKKITDRKIVRAIKNWISVIMATMRFFLAKKITDRKIVRPIKNWISVIMATMRFFLANRNEENN